MSTILNVDCHLSSLFFLTCILETSCSVDGCSLSAKFAAINAVPAAHHKHIQPLGHCKDQCHLDGHSSHDHSMRIKHLLLNCVLKQPRKDLLFEQHQTLMRLVQPTEQVTHIHISRSMHHVLHMTACFFVIVCFVDICQSTLHGSDDKMCNNDTDLLFPHFHVVKVGQDWEEQDAAFRDWTTKGELFPEFGKVVKMLLGLSTSASICYQMKAMVYTPQHNDWGWHDY